MRTRIAFIMFLLVLGCGRAWAAPDEDAIRHLMSESFDRPDARLVVEPVIVSADYALAGWMQGDMGGRALLRRRNGAWAIVLCSGDAIMSAAALAQAGVPANAAAAILQGTVTAERGMAPGHVAKFSTFDGIMMMEGQGHHPQR